MPEGLHHLAVNQQSLVESDSSSGGDTVLKVFPILSPLFLLLVELFIVGGANACEDYISSVSRASGVDRKFVR